MKTVVVTFFATIVLGAAGAAAFIYSGLYDVAATDRHWPVTYWMVETMRVRSIKSYAAGITAPAGYDAQDKVVSAASHFSAHCAVCHGAPGAERGDLARGMYPLPPDLTYVSQRYSPGELFWIVKNGIKMSGMPSMADDGDEMLWATVAFLQKLPSMSPDEYNDLWMESQAQSGGGHMMNMNGMDMHDMHPGTGNGPEGADQQHAH